MNQKGYRTTALLFFLRVEMLNVLYILEALRLNYIMPGYLRSSLRCVRWDKYKYCIGIYPTWKQIFPPADQVTGYTGECVRRFVFMKV